MRANIPIIRGSSSPGKSFLSLCSFAMGAPSACGQHSTLTRVISWLEETCQDHVKDFELLAQVSAYPEKYEQWEAVRQDVGAKEVL